MVIRSMFDYTQRKFEFCVIGTKFEATENFYFRSSKWAHYPPKLDILNTNSPSDKATAAL